MEMAIQVLSAEIERLEAIGSRDMVSICPTEAKVEPKQNTYQQEIDSIKNSITFLKTRETMLEAVLDFNNGRISQASFHWIIEVLVKGFEKPTPDDIAWAYKVIEKYESNK